METENSKGPENTVEKIKIFLWTRNIYVKKKI